MKFWTYLDGSEGEEREASFNSNQTCKFWRPATTHKKSMHLNISNWSILHFIYNDCVQYLRKQCNKLKYLNNRGVGFDDQKWKDRATMMIMTHIHPSNYHIQRINKNAYFSDFLTLIQCIYNCIQFYYFWIQICVTFLCDISKCFHCIRFGFTSGLYCDKCKMNSLL